MEWFLAAGALLAALLYARSEHEKRHFAVDTYEIRSEKLVAEERTFVFLSDLHNRCFGEDQRELLEAVDRVKPDAVMIGGDLMITGKRKDEVNIKPALFLVKKLAEKYPVYYGSGNHESRMEWRKESFGSIANEYWTELEKAGVKRVSGSNRYLIGSDISVAGLEIPEKCYKKRNPVYLKEGDIQRQLGEADKERYQILLAHTPLMFEQYKNWNADLVLSGHIHGGTIRLPFLGGVMTPQFQFFYKYCGGMFSENGHTLIVSRGLGTHSVNIRFNNRAQLVVLKLCGRTPDQASDRLPGPA